MSSEEKSSDKYYILVGKDAIREKLRMAHPDIYRNEYREVYLHRLEDIAISNHHDLDNLLSDAKEQAFINLMP